MNTTIGALGDVVEIHDFPEEGDVSKGAIVCGSIDEVTGNVQQRFRGVSIIRTNKKDGRSLCLFPRGERVNIPPAGLIPLENSAPDSRIQKYRFNFRDQANAIVADWSFQHLM
ncbi:MAG: hypothetical protein WC604_04635 [Candidatus Gracilibacteria bacterium]